jgi:hypothetical protein
LLEHRCNKAEIDLYYGDGVQIPEEGYVPYGWQFKDENISIKSAKGKRINCFGILTRDNQFEYATTYETIDSNFIIEKINSFPYQIKSIRLSFWTMQKYTSQKQ